MNSKLIDVDIFPTREKDKQIKNEIREKRRSVNRAVKISKKIVKYSLFNRTGIC